MPDPRQMSGHPRPDQQVPAGMLTVKIIRGDLATIAPEGTPVHLVAMSVGGKAQELLAHVNSEGRAEFKDLKTDGTVTYYALCQLGADRLGSDPIQMPPRVGVRLVLAGAKDGTPAIDDENKENGELVPAGEVDVLIRSEIVVKTATLRRVTGETVAEQAVDPTSKLARWTGVPSGDGAYFVEVKNGLKSYVTAPFLLGPGAGVKRLLVVFDGPLLALRGVAEAQDELLAVELQLYVGNLTGAPFDPGPDGLLLPLPQGFKGSLKDDDPASRAALIPGEGVKLTGPVPPGERQLVVQMSLPITDGRVVFDIATQLRLVEGQIYVYKTENLAVSTEKGVFSSPKVQRADDGREYLVVSDMSAQAGEHVRFTVAGLPVAARWPAVARGVFGLIVALLVVLALAFAVRRPDASLRADDEHDDERRELVAQRERLYAELITLQRAHAARRIDADAFAMQRRGIMTKLVLVHRQLDDLDATSGPST